MEKTSPKTELTIVIPSIKLLEASGIIPSFLASDTAKRLKVQFVYLQNLKNGGGATEASIQDFGTHELITIPNPRFFDSAEENIYRLQDIIDLLKPYVFLVGEHDFIDWAALEEGLAFREKHALDVMAWNILAREQREDGSYSEVACFQAIEDPSMANHYVQLLLSGQTMSGKVGYFSILSLYGQIDWACYIGNHLYSRAALAHMLQYHFGEYIFSHVYMQAMFFHEHETRYGFFNKNVIARHGEEYKNQRKGENIFHSPRVKQGASPIFWMANISCLVELDDDVLFNFLANCLRVALGVDEKGNHVFMRHTFLGNILVWCKDALVHKRLGRSYYMPNESLNGSLQDMRYVRRFLIRFLRCMETYPAIYAPVKSETRRALQDALATLTQYLTGLNLSESLIDLTHSQLEVAQKSFTPEVYIQVSRAAFLAYTTQTATMAA